MGNAIGLLEVQGYSVALAAMNQACKAANIKIEGMDCNNPAAGDHAPIPVVIQVKFTGSVSDVKVVIVDYLNQVKRSNVPGRNGQYDWTEQIEVSKALKQYAQDYNVLIFSPYQT